MTIELKQCPFCGGEADIHECADFDSDMLKVVYGGMCGVHCTKCNIATLPYPREQEAIEAWNRRVEPQQKQVEQLEGYSFEVGV